MFFALRLLFVQRLIAAIQLRTAYIKQLTRMDKGIDIIGEISSLTCCVCYEKIAETKSLHCGHSICIEPCLKHLIEKEDSKCPSCQKLIQLPSSGQLSDLPTNHGLGSVLRSYRDAMKSPKTPFPTEEIPSFPQDTSPNPHLYKDPNSHASPEHNSAINEPIKNVDKCRQHQRSLRFFCNTCSDDVCYMCIQSIHGKHEFVVRDKEDADGECIRDAIVRASMQKKTHKDISVSLHLSREDYLDTSRRAREEIQEAAKRIHELVSLEENALVNELGGLTASRSDYFMDLYTALEHAMVKENRFAKMVTNLGEIIEDNNTFIGLKDLEDIDNVLTDIDKETNALVQLSSCRHPHLQFVKQNHSGNMLGRLQKVCNLKSSSSSHKVVEEDIRTLSLKKVWEIDAERSCVSLVWLNGERCVSVNDHTSQKGFVQFKVLTIGEEISYQSEEMKRSGHDPFHVCSIPSDNEGSIILAHGRDFIKVTFSTKPGESPLYEKTSLDYNIEAICWGQYKGEYVVLLSHPWQVNRVDKNGSCQSSSSLASHCYGPFLANINSSFVVADISEKISGFVVKDTMKIFPDRLIEAPSSLRNAWPAGMTFNRETHDWFFLWKSSCNKAKEEVDWIVTRHTSSFEFRGIILSGSLAHRDPRSISVHKNKFAVLYHGGKIVIFTIHSSNFSVRKKQASSGAN